MTDTDLDCWARWLLDRRDRALRHVAPGGRVIFCDVSPDLIEHCRVLCEEQGVSGGVDFLLADATELSAVADESVDCVILRSVLCYVHDKQRAFASFYRVLKPGGRLALFEPINRFGHAHASTGSTPSRTSTSGSALRGPNLRSPR